MNKTLAASLALGLVGLVGCPDIKTDTGEGNVGPTVQFDPSASIIPFPNNLVLDPTTGRVNLPKQCNESLAQGLIRTTLLNTLDGFGTYESALQVTFSEALDASTLTGHVLLYQRAKGTTPTDPGSAKAIPVMLTPVMTPQSSADCSTSKMVTTLLIIAQGVLDQRSTYTVALTRGIKTASGADFGPSFFWSLVSQEGAPVTVDASGNVTENHTPLDPRDEAQLVQLHGVSLLWQAHRPALDFLTGAGHARGDVLVAWEFNTQSNDELDPAVAGSPAAVASASTTPLQGTSSIIPNGVTPSEFLTGKGIPCGSLPCDAIGDILGGGLISKSYQKGTTDMMAVPGAWTDPVHPTVVNANYTIQAFAVVPAGAVPANGWPTVVFGHALTSSKSTLFAIAPQLAQAGFASVAIDFVAHDSRAIRTSTDAAKGCADSGGTRPDPTKFPQCYAPFLSTDLAGTRDNFRQTVLDLEGLVAALKACGTAGCGALQVDAAHLVYLGLSLGGIVGSTLVANVPDFKAAVLNVPGVGLVDILENTASLAIRCSLVDALIAVGVVTGAPFNPADGTGLCTTEAWKAQAGYQQFSVIARWGLDPADGANFTRKLAGRRILIQEVVDDQVVPNIATDREGALVGLMPANADVAASATPAPSAAIAPANPNMNKWVRYPAVPGDGGTFPGNAFEHPSLLLPAGTDMTHPAGTPAGQLGTARVQTDAITFLFNNR
ncbi:MAG TPA: hypothetical protein VHN14_04455 [Kofleriaceae bacterium]|jgi:dienelactone hydrolase|nr:hypothetical protein [Kofleriaceae bacterium]